MIHITHTSPIIRQESDDCVHSTREGLKITTCPPGVSCSLEVTHFGPQRSNNNFQMAATLDPVSAPNMLAYDLVEDDEDAEHEEDPMMDEKIFVPRHAKLGLQNTELVGEDEDEEEEGEGHEEATENKEGLGEGEGQHPHQQPEEAVEEDEEEDDEHEEDDDDDDDGETVGPVKMPQGGEDFASEANEDGEQALSLQEASMVSDNDSSDKESSDAESDGVAEWEEQSDDRDDEDVGLGNDNCCMYVSRGSYWSTGR